jgi:hypothetical protein
MKGESVVCFRQKHSQNINIIATILKKIAKKKSPLNISSSLNHQPSSLNDLKTISALYILPYVASP